MKIFNEKIKQEIINEFNKRNGIYSRLYNVSKENKNGFGEPIGIIYRCESSVDKDRVIIFRYTWNNSKINKYDFENLKIKGMAIALKKADRYLLSCKKKNKEVEDDFEIMIIKDNKINLDYTNEYIKTFKNRVEKYYHKHMKIITVIM